MTYATSKHMRKPRTKEEERLRAWCNRIRLSVNPKAYCYAWLNLGRKAANDNVIVNSINPYGSVIRGNELYITTTTGHLKFDIPRYVMDLYREIREGKHPHLVRREMNHE